MSVKLLIGFCQKLGMWQGHNKQQFTDVFALNEVLNTKLIDFDLNTHPRIKKWFDEIRTISAVQEFTLIAQETLAAITSG